MALRKKLRRVKRFAYLGGLVGVVVGVRRMRQGQAAGPVSLEPVASWPPLRPAPSPDPTPATSDDAATADPEAPATPEPTAPAPGPEASSSVTPLADLADGVTTTSAGDDTAPTGGSAWVAPNDDGSCPVSHPIKANDNSMIFHQPGGRFYERTHAERCYVDAAAAEADGYRAAKGANGGPATSGGAT